MTRRLWWAWFLGAVLILGCRTPLPCEPKPCPVWSRVEIQARAALRKEHGCDAASLEANPEKCDRRWERMEAAQGRLAVHCDGQEQPSADEKAAKARPWWRFWE